MESPTDLKKSHRSTFLIILFLGMIIQLICVLAGYILGTRNNKMTSDIILSQLPGIKKELMK